MKKHSKWNRWWIAITITAVTLIVVIVYLYETIKKRKIDHPIGKQAHVEIAMRSLQAVINKIEIHFGKMLNISGLVDTDGSLIIAKDKKPS